MSQTKIKNSQNRSYNISNSPPLVLKKIIDLPEKKLQLINESNAKTIPSEIPDKIDSSIIHFIKQDSNNLAETFFQDKEDWFLSPTDDNYDEEPLEEELELRAFYSRSRHRQEEHKKATIGKHNRHVKTTRLVRCLEKKHGWSSDKEKELLTNILYTARQLYTTYHCIDTQLGNRVSFDALELAFELRQRWIGEMYEFPLSWTLLLELIRVFGDPLGFDDRKNFGSGRPGATLPGLDECWDILQGMYEYWIGERFRLKSILGMLPREQWPDGIEFYFNRFFKICLEHRPEQIDMSSWIVGMGSDEDDDQLSLPERQLPFEVKQTLRQLGVL